MSENRIAWGKNGHEQEYCVRVDRELNPEKYDDRDFILKSYSQKLVEILGNTEFEILNRGTRIEIAPRNMLWEDRKMELLAPGVHERVKAAVEAVFGPSYLEINHVEPMIDIPAPCTVEGCDEVAASAFRLKFHMVRKHS